MAHFLIVGLGDIGSGLAQSFMNQGHKVSAIRRKPTASKGVVLYAQDILHAAPLRLPAEKPQAVFIIVTPEERSQVAYEAAFLTLPERLLRAMESAYHALPPVVFVSSTAVYGQGSTMSENSPTEPQAFNGQVLLRAEAKIRAATQATVVRFSGIYGPGRESRIRLARALALGEKSTPKAVWSNRIHSEDVVGLLHHLGELWAAGHTPPAVVVGTDNHPVVNLKVLNWLAQQQGLPLNMKWDAVSGRKVMSGYIAQGHYTLRYPSFREGYAALLGINPTP